MIRVAVLLAASGCHLAFPLENEAPLDAPPDLDPCAVDDSLRLCLDFEQPASEVLITDRSGLRNHAMASKFLARSAQCNIGGDSHGAR